MKCGNGLLSCVMLTSLLALSLPAATPPPVLEVDFQKGVVPAGTTGIKEDDLALGALACDNTTRYRIAVPEALKGTTDFTVSMWFIPQKESESGQTTLIHCRRSPHPERNVGFWFGHTNLRLEFRWWITAKSKWEGIDSRLPEYKTSVCVVQSPVQRGAWQMATVVCRGTDLEIYHNGKLNAKTVMDKPLSIVEDVFRLAIREDGDGSFYYGFWGLIGRVAAYRQALTSDEISELHQQESGRFTTPVQLPPPPDYDPDFKVSLKRTAAYFTNPPPDDMPKGTVATQEMRDGVSVLCLDGEPQYPMMYAPTCWVGDDAIKPSIQDFTAAGVTLMHEFFSTNLRGEKLMGEWWEGEGQYNWKRIDERFAMFLAACPQARTMIRLKIDPPSWWWFKERQDFVPVYYSGGEYGRREGWCGLGSPEWEAAYSRMLRDLIGYIEKQPYAGHVIGYLIGGGSASEWYYHGQDKGLIDYSPIAHREFAAYCQRRYGTIAKVNAAWGTAFTDFAEIKTPDPELRLATENGVFRDPVKARPCIDYVDYLNDTTIRTMRNAATIIKEVTGGRCLAGYFYSYLPLARLHGTFHLQGNGHTILGEAVKDPNINFFATPLDYGRRKGGGEGLHIGNFNGTYMLNNKMFWDECDYRTHTLLRYRGGEATANEDETINVMRRSFGYTLTKGNALWWFALAGNHAFHSERMMDDVAKYIQLGQSFLSVPKTQIAEAALVMDEPTIKYLSMTSATSELFRGLMWETYKNAHRSGALFDLYLSSDLDHPRMKDYKLYVFTNQCYVDAETTARIQAKLRRNGATAVWLYAPGYITAAGFSLDSMRELTGMAFKATQPGGNAPAPIISRQDGGNLEAVNYRGFQSMYNPRGLTPAQLRELCQQLGIHVYADADDVLSANANFLMLHTSTTGEKTITLPRPSRVTEVISGKVVADKATQFKENLDLGITRVYRLE